jgi:hypothetical protein
MVADTAAGIAANAIFRAAIGVNITNVCNTK